MEMHAGRLALASWVVSTAIVGAARAQQVDPDVYPTNKVVARALAIETGLQLRGPKEARLSSGVVRAALAASGELGRRMDASGGAGDDFDHARGRGTEGCTNVYTSDDRKNIRVNQDCSLRRQAEVVLAINPTDPENMIAGQNDSRIGFNHCGYDFSFDGGKTWGDMVPPF